LSLGGPSNGAKFQAAQNRQTGIQQQEKKILGTT
jgi:hypothetical protein